MRVISLGAGAIGGYFGGRLAEAGADVAFLVRPSRKRQLQEHGLRIESQFGNFSGPVRALTRDEVQEPADLVLLTCKAYDLEDAIEAIRRAVGPRTAVLPLLNGLAHMERLNQQFGPTCVLGGLAKIAATLAPDGTVRHLSEWRFLTFGEQDGMFSERVGELKTLFDSTDSVVATASTDVMQAMWEKVVHLTTIAGMTCLMRASVGEIARTPGGTALMERFLAANAAIAGAEGYTPSEEFMAEYRALVADQSSDYTASMLRDLERSGPVEADHILGWMLARAETYHLDTTLHWAAYVHLKAYEQRRAAGRLPG